MKYLKKGFSLKKELIKKHKRGQKKYGAFSFLNDGRDMKLEACDELIDAINYLVYGIIKDTRGEANIKKWNIKKFNNIYKNYIKKELIRPTHPFLVKLINLINKLNET